MLAVAMGAAPSAGRADPPGNDAQAAAISIDATSSLTAGTTDGATAAKGDPSNPCDDGVTATLWYSLTNVPNRAVVLRLVAHDGLDAVLDVYRSQGNRLNSVACDETGDSGIATVGFTGRNGDIVLVGQRTGSPPGAFELRALVPAPTEPVPGKPLRGVVHATVEQYLDETDLWHADLRAGTTYRISLVVRDKHACPNVRMFQPGGPPSDVRGVMYLRCNGSTSFTPGPDGGGRYLLLVGISYASGLAPYRLQVSRAQADDTAPGLALPVGVWRQGRLTPSATDQLDMYRFVLAVQSDVIIQLGRPWPKGVALLLLRDMGKSVAAGKAIRRSLAPGTYYVVVSAPTGSRAQDYRLLLREREVSTLSVEGVQQGIALLGSPLTLSAHIGAPAGRVATLQVDRFDPLDGWLFLRGYSLPVGAGDEASLAWTPQHVGRYRARITAPSRSGYVYITVREPTP